MRLDQSLFLSPHLDDAVFACGEAIASARAATVATLFAGRPQPGAALTSWDADCGFAPGDDVVGTRREEDRSALALLGAEPLWLEFRDDQYGSCPPMSALAKAVSQAVAQRHAATVFFPLGLFHQDHRRASDAALACIGEWSRVHWYAYEDAIYRRIDGLVAQRIATLRDRGIAVSRQDLSTDRSAHARKQAAIACYRSQLRGLGTRRGHADALGSEAYWRVEAQGRVHE
jgi:LmbE family N-acetylglucosaminyl deacetylase